MIKNIKKPSEFIPLDTTSWPYSKLEAFYLENEDFLPETIKCIFPNGKIKFRYIIFNRVKLYSPRVIEATYNRITLKITKAIEAFKKGEFLCARSISSQSIELPNLDFSIEKKFIPAEVFDELYRLALEREKAALTRILKNFVADPTVTPISILSKSIYDESIFLPTGVLEKKHWESDLDFNKIIKYSDFIEVAWQRWGRWVVTCFDRFLEDKNLRGVVIEKELSNVSHKKEFHIKVEGMAMFVHLNLWKAFNLKKPDSIASMVFHSVLREINLRNSYDSIVPAVLNNIKTTIDQWREHQKLEALYGPITSPEAIFLHQFFEEHFLRLGLNMVLLKWIEDTSILNKYSQSDLDLCAELLQEVEKTTQVFQKIKIEDLLRLIKADVSDPAQRLNLILNAWNETFCDENNIIFSRKELFDLPDTHPIIQTILVLNNLTPV